MSERRSYKRVLPGRGRRRIKPALDKKHLRGAKYSVAMMLVAAGKLTDEEIAAALRVDIAAVIEAKSKRYFQDKVNLIRRALAWRAARGNVA